MHPLVYFLLYDLHLFHFHQLVCFICIFGSVRKKDSNEYYEQELLTFFDSQFWIVIKEEELQI